MIARWYLGRLGNAIADGSELALGVIDTLKVFPVPPWLHRTAMSATKLGGVDIAEGDKIAVHLGSSALDQPGPDMLFGGKCRYDVSPQQAAPLHACPGRELALGVLMGMLTAVLQEHDLRRDEGTLMLSFRAT